MKRAPRNSHCAGSWPAERTLRFRDVLVADGVTEKSRAQDCHLHRLLMWATNRAQSNGDRSTGRRGTLPFPLRSRAADRIRAGLPLRAVAAELGVGREALRRALHDDGIVLPVRAPVLMTQPHRRPSYCLPGRGRSRALPPAEFVALLAGRHAGGNLRSLARSAGVSHETLRRNAAEASSASGIPSVAGVAT